MVSIYLPEKDGIAIYTENLCNELKKQNVDVVKIGTLNSSCDYMLDLKSIWLHKNLKKIIAKEKIDVLHIQYIASRFSKYLLNMNLIYAMKKINIPIVTTMHEVQYEAINTTDRILCMIEKKIVNNSDFIIAHTKNQSNFIIKKYGVKSECILMGLDIKKNELSDDKIKNLLFFGIMGRRKGLEYLINSLKYLKGYSLAVAGRFEDKEYEKEIMSLIKKIDASKNSVTIKSGWISEEEKEKYYKNADIVILPYTWAPYQSAVLHDALSYGIPIVVTKTGAIWEIVDEFKCGKVVNAKESREIANGIIDVAKNYKIYCNGARNYQEESTWNKSVKKLIKEYKSVLLNHENSRKCTPMT